MEEWRDGVVEYSNRDPIQCDGLRPEHQFECGHPDGQPIAHWRDHRIPTVLINASFFHWDFGVPGIDSDTSNLAYPSYTFPEPGTYTVTLVANPGWPCADTSTSVYDVYAPVNPELEVTGFDCSTGTPVFDFGTVETYNGADFGWDFGALASSSSSNLAEPGGIGFPNIEDVEAELTIVQNGCIGSGVLD